MVRPSSNVLPADRRGAALVEFALVLPLILVFLVWMVDFGRIWHHRVIVSNAARFGSQLGVAKPVPVADMAKWEADIRLQVEEELSQLSSTAAEDSTITVQLPNSNSDFPEWVKVTVEYPFHTLIPWPGVPEVVSIRESSVSPNLH